jgi:hypothetical protein
MEKAQYAQMVVNNSTLHRNTVRRSGDAISSSFGGATAFATFGTSKHASRKKGIQAMRT